MRVPLSIAAFLLASLIIVGEIGSWRGTTCADGWNSPSIGKRGACSHHGGVKRAGGGAMLVGLAVAAGIGVFVYSKLPPDKPPKRPPLDQISPPKKRRIKHPKCPKCNLTMRLRVARSGPYQGSRFWGCSNYPRCKGTRNYSRDRNLE